MLLSGAWGKVIHGKHLKKKFRDTVPLTDGKGGKLSREKKEILHFIHFLNYSMHCMIKENKGYFLHSLPI